MGSGALDSSQWLSVKEETIFLHDGLMRVTDLAELPSELGVSEQGDTEQEMAVVGQCKALGEAHSEPPPLSDSRMLAL
ncbi:probable E3 ubiquitin-protein ligase HECTD4 isoform X1 [Tachysurus ichikawai]